MQLKSGVFSYLVNKAAFLDRIVLSVWSGGKPVSDQISEVRNVGILSGDSLYSRCLSGKWTLTGNPVQILYGKVSLLPRVPPFRLILRSEAIPITGAQINTLARSIFPNAVRMQVSQVELTLDLKGLSVPHFRRCMVHHARGWSEKSGLADRKTLYVGSRCSPWQVVIYDKAANIVRYEVVLRRGFLFKRGLSSPDALVTLRQLDLWRLASVRRFRRERVVSATEGWSNTTLKEMLLDWDVDGRPLQTLYRFLRKTGIQPDSVLRRSSCQLRMDEMLRNLIW
jgi:hypothetical protein